jgi:acyl dehydratase
MDARHTKGKSERGERLMTFNDYIGRSVGPQKIEYNWRDVALYALAVGAHGDDLIYTYERNMKCLPSFGVVPYWNAVNNYPQRPIPYAASILIREALARERGVTPDDVGGLHMGHEIVVYRPIDPIKGSLIFEDKITGIYDRGNKGIVVQTNAPVYDEAGNLLCENISNTAWFEGGNFGGKEPPKTDVTIPERAPDCVVNDFMSETQNILYRLTGDTNHIHINPEIACAAGFPRTFMQGLCSYGFACRMAIQAVIPGEPERMSRMAAQMRNVCYPGAEIALHVWKAGAGKVLFQLINAADQKPVLDKGVFEY